MDELFPLQVYFMFEKSQDVIEKWKSRTTSVEIVHFVMYPKQFFLLPSRLYPIEIRSGARERGGTRATTSQEVRLGGMGWVRGASLRREKAKQVISRGLWPRG